MSICSKNKKHQLKTKQNKILGVGTMDVPGPRRIYLKCIPKNWTWEEAKWWCYNLGLPWPSHVHVHPGGADMTSCYIHWHCTASEAQGMATALTGHYLVHRATAAMVAPEDWQPKAVPKASRLKCSTTEAVGGGGGPHSYGIMDTDWTAIETKNGWSVHAVTGSGLHALFAL